MQSTLRRLLKALIAPFVGFLLYSTGVWKLSPLLGIQGRGLMFFRGGLLVLGAVVVTFVGWFVVRWARRAAKGAAADEIDAAFKVATQRLAAARNVSVRSLRDLPVILILGPDGSAKTTTLMQAGLEPDLLAGEPLKGSTVAPTKHVNLWYAHGALFAEVGGKLLSNPDAWAHLATRLRPRRLGAVFAGRQQPPRAALLCFSCEDLVADDQEKMRTAAGVLRERLSVASRILGIRLPIYVVLTKADRVRNFPEFVRELTSEEVQGAVGATFPLSLETDLGAYATREFERLQAAMEKVLSALSLQRLRILPRISSQDDRNAAYEFPRELAKLSPRMIEFLVEVCRPKHLDVSPFVRGLYLAGVRPVVVDAANAAASPTRVPQWLFLQGVFHDVVRQDHVALGMTRAGHGIRQLRRIAFGSLSAAGLVFLLGLTVSYFSNRGLTNRVHGAALATANLAPDAPLEQALLALDGLRNQLEVLLKQRDEGAPFWSTWGLYRGDDLTAHGRRVYWSRFQERVLAGIRGSVRADLQAFIANPDGVSPDSARAFVARYLLVTSRPDKLTPDTAGRLIDRSESRMLAGSGREVAMRQLQFYGGGLCAGDGLCQQEIDLTLAGNACTTLRGFEDSGRLYRMLTDRVGAGAQPVKFNGGAVVQNRYEVPAAYTRSGWIEAHKAFASGDVTAGGEDWVYQGIQCEVAAQRDVGSINSTLHRQFDSTYVQQWQAFLRAAQVSVSGGFEGAGDALTRLGGSQSPLLGMLALVSDNTSSPDSTVVLPDSTVLKEAFQPAHVVMPPGRRAVLRNPTIDPWADGVAALGELLKNPTASRDEATMQDAVATARSGAGAATRGFAIGPAEVANREITRLLGSPITSAQSLVAAGPALEAGKAVRDFCARFNQLAQLYPFSDSPRLVTPDDLAGMFHPTDGELAKLANETLQDLLVKRGAVYERAPRAAVSQTFVDFLNQAMRVGATLFPDGRGPRLLFAIRLVAPAGVGEVTLNLDGRSITRSPANQTVEPVTWVFNDGRTSSASLRVVLRGGQSGSLDFPSSWGIFRLFGKASWVSDPSGSYRLTWRVPVDRQTVEVTATVSPNNNGAPVLEPTFLPSLRCR